MPRITVIITKDLDERLRHYNNRKGDLSKIAEKALTDWINSAETLES
jgi:hypothetical protein